MGYVQAPRGQNPWISEPATPTPNGRPMPPMYSTSRGNFARSGPGNPEFEAGKAMTDIATYNARYIREWVMPRQTGDLKTGDEQRLGHTGKGGSTGQTTISRRPKGPNGGGTGATGPDLNSTPFGVRMPDLTAPLGPEAPFQPATSQAPWKGSSSGPQAPWKGSSETFTQMRDRQAMERTPKTVSVPFEAGAPLPWLGGASSPSSRGPAATGPLPGAAPEVTPRAPWQTTTGPTAAGFGKRLAMTPRSQARQGTPEGPSLLGALPAPQEQVGPSATRRKKAGMDPRRRGTWANYE